MSQKVTLVDVQSIYYKVVRDDKEMDDKRYIDVYVAKKKAEEYKGEVIKVAKRIVETIEFEKLAVL